ncbi:putative MFS family arabinose efflux permease [Haloactinopolyspora alba]|uniref:Putative MFS family arabinose efflux permease n=1 Tax=Haloactinopolyspora alba TaxID=648780 RepID=A0A2P8DPG0_9ACTN|nr:MFS transporter [Haloactinopolyspora alba]PSK99107.1 putative MFS family arabinose efflux permease [Haloactinopolyspora alba]
MLLFKGTFDEGCGGASGAASERTAPARTRETSTAVYLLVVLTAGAYLPSPLYAGYQHAFGFGDLTMTLIYATFALVSAPSLLLFGPAADTAGPRAVLRISVAVSALASSCFALASGPEWLLAGRAAQGLALGAATGAAAALITAHASTGSRARASTTASTAFVAGTAAGPIAAGVLAQYAPAPQVLPYLMHLALLGYGWRRVSALAAPGPIPGRLRPSRPRIPAGWRLRFGTAAAAGFLAWTAAGLFLAVVPAVLGGTAGIDNLAVVGAIVGAVLACSVASQPLVGRFGPELAQLAGLGAVGVGLGALALTGGGSLSVTLLAAVAAGVGHGLAFGGATATVDAAGPQNQRAAISSALYLAFYLGAGGPAVAVGLLTLWHPLATAVSWIGAAAAVLVPFVGAALVLQGRGLTPPRRGRPVAPARR